MKVRILKGIVSIYGAMVPGKEIIVTDHIAKNWIKEGIAESLEEPKDIPAGMFWCAEHQTLHKMESRPGKRCLKRIEAEKVKAEEAEEKARQEAEAAAEAAEAEAEPEPEAEAEAEGEPEPEPEPEPE